jgi:Uma2 family endonuclease
VTASIRPPTRLWTRDEYHRIAELGLFAPEERLELLNGEILKKVSPQSYGHAQCVRLTAEVLRALFAVGYHVSEEKPIVLTDASEPEPDVVLVRGALRQASGHPTPATAALVVEVSESTLEFDRAEKAAAYARSGIAEYWIVNLRARCLEVHRDPGPIENGRYGYRLRRIVPAEDQITTLERPEQHIAVADLLPGS